MTWKKMEGDEGYRNDEGYLLVPRTERNRRLWELRNTAGDVITTQYELPLRLEGAPLAWASSELSQRNLL